MAKSSEISGFYKLSVDERIRLVAEFANLSEADVSLLKKASALDLDTANRMVENVICNFPLPLGIATNFLINGKDYLVPMVIEEPSVIAAASHAAKLCRPSGGLKTEVQDAIMVGQIQLTKLDEKKIPELVKKINASDREIIALEQELNLPLKAYGGGLRHSSCRVLDTIRGKNIIVDLEIECLDSMGANAVNTTCEALTPYFENVTGGKARLRILTNLATKRLARASTVWRKEEIGEGAVEGVLDAYAFAAADPFRATTHNKGIMNGIDAVVIATGNDWRAIEAGAHSFASISGKYAPLTRYRKNDRGDLVGEIELPLAVGTVGGASKTHPLAQLAIKILGIKSAKELAAIMASVGLAQNFAALRALSTEGIQRGHMELHARNIAVIAGARGADIDWVADKMAKEKNVRVERATQLLKEKGSK